MNNYFKKILKLYTSTKVSETTQDEFFTWLLREEHASEKEEALKGLWEKARKNKSKENLKASFANLKAIAGIPSIPEEGPRKIRPVVWQAVAVITTIFAMTSIYLVVQEKDTPTDLVEQYMPIAQTGITTLPDGTRVQLNSESTLIYPSQFSGKTRSVYLTGEANFKVIHNPTQPFIVKSNDFQVTALGTEFNVSAYPGNTDLKATLISGSVRIDFNNLQSKVILHPNEQITYHKQSHKSEISQPDMLEVTAWQRGELVFRDMSLKDVITVLERKYPYTFSYSLYALKEDKFTFRFKDNAPLSEVMDIITKVVENTSYRIVGNKCYIMPDE